MPRMMSVLIAVVSLLWGALTIYTEIIDVDPDEYSIKSPEVRQQMQNCAGTFAQRQACVERITETEQQLGFLVWCKKVVVILGPPLVLWGLSGWATRQGRVRTAPAAGAAQSRQAGAAAPRPRPRPSQRQGQRDVVSEDPPLRKPQEPPSPQDKPGEGSPVFSGGRREPVRRRDR